MTYPCGIIRDLLPLYIDDVCNEESKQVVEIHLEEFEVAIKEVNMGDVSVSAKVYSLGSQGTIPADEVTDSESVTIFSDEKDNSEVVNVKIPGIGNINLTKNVIEKCGHATVISFSSEYFLRNIETETKDNAIYITGFKTTLLGNKAESYQKQTCMLEFQEINKIVFVDDKGMETVLWSR